MGKIFPRQCVEHLSTCFVVPSYFNNYLTPICELISNMYQSSFAVHPNKNLWAFLCMYLLIVETFRWKVAFCKSDAGNEAVFLYEFKLNMLDFMFRFMLSNICYHNKNQRSFLKLKFLFKFMFRFMFPVPQKW